MPPRRSNPLALAILVYLGERERHPYEIAADMRLRHQHDSIKLNYGSLYSVVAALEKQGLIEVHDVMREGKRPERTVYSITEAGRRESADWLSELLATPMKEYRDFEAALSLIGSLPPDEVAGLLRKRLMVLDHQVHTAEALMSTRDPAQLPRLFVLENEYAHTLLLAERQFVAELVAAIEQGTLEGLEAWRQWSQ